MITSQLNHLLRNALITDDRLTALFTTLDRLHSAVTDGDLTDVTTLPADQILGWLKDIQFTVDQTIDALENPEAADHEMLSFPFYFPAVRDAQDVNEQGSEDER